MPQSNFGHVQTLAQMCGLTPNEPQSLAHSEGLGGLRLIRRFFIIGDRSYLILESALNYSIDLIIAY